MWLNRLRNLSLVMAFGAAIIPFATYITHENRDWLWLLIGANIFAYIMVALTTIRITLDAAGREKAKSYVPPRWADNPVMSKWYSAVRRAWKWHGLAAVARMGLAIALAQHLHSVPGHYGFSGILEPFYYYSYNGMNYILVYPPAITVLISGTLLVTFAISETAFLVSLTLAARRLTKNPVLTYLIVLLSRAMLVVSIVSSVNFAVREYHINAPRAGIYHSKLPELQSFLETAHRPIFALLDNGTMIAAETLRPSCAGYEWDDPICQAFTDLNYLLPYLILTGIAMILYGILTWLTLRAAMRSRGREKMAAA